MFSFQTLAMLFLLAISSLSIWLADGFITFIAFTDEVASMTFSQLLYAMTELNLFTILALPEYWYANSNHSFLEAPAFWFEPATSIAGILTFVLLLLFSRIVQPLTGYTISAIMLLLGIGYMLVSWGILVDVTEPQQVGSFLSIGVQGLLVHSILCFGTLLYMIIKNAYYKIYSINNINLA